MGMETTTVTIVKLIEITIITIYLKVCFISVNLALAVAAVEKVSNHFLLIIAPGALQFTNPIKFMTIFMILETRYYQ